MHPFTPIGDEAVDRILRLLHDDLQDYPVKLRLENPERLVTVVMMLEQFEKQWGMYESIFHRVSAERLEQAKNEIKEWLPTLTTAPRPVARKAADEPRRNWVTEAVRENRYYWKLLNRKMCTQLDNEACKQIDSESEEILRLMPNPMDASDWHAYGLVVGQVQSGKTSNYSALIAKAADAGYRMIVVLAGVHDDLRNQTQERLDEDFIGEHWFCNDKGSQTRSAAGVGMITDLYDPHRAPRRATYTDQDFDQCPVQAEDLPWLFVVKKNPQILRRLNTWAAASNVRDRWPLLIIDDEADQASINTASNPERATTINRLIRELIKQFPRACYVGYTATPFANILINAEADSEKFGQDLFPRDFIFHMRASSKYYGPKIFFGPEFENPLDVFMPFGHDHAFEWIQQLRKSSRKAAEDMPVEVRTALLQFLLSSGIRLWRECRRRAGELERKPLRSSMLVHVTHLVREQALVRDGIASLLTELRTELLYAPDDFFAELETLWMVQRTEATPAIRAKRRELTRIDRLEDWVLPESLDELRPYVEEVLLTLEVHLVNGQAKHAVGVGPDAQAPSFPRIKPVLYVGGNKLSRGLTLPGLCVSIFLRGSSMYDTLLQMGRWFGYRDGYADLCRISTTNMLIERFRAITEATVDLEQQIVDMNANDRTPDKYRLTVLAHPGLKITAANKMRQAVDSVHYFNGVVVDNRFFTLSKDGRAVYADLYVRPGLDFLRTVERKGRLVYASRSFGIQNLPEERICFRKASSDGIRGRLWRDVPADVVLEFLENYGGGRADLVRAIRASNKLGRLVRWTVFVPGDRDADNVFFGSKPVERKSKLTPSKSELSMRSLLGGQQNYYGVSEELIRKTQDRVEANAEKDPGDYGVFFRMLRLTAGTEEPEVGHIILYNISPNDETAALPAFHDAGYGAGRTLPVVSFYLWLPKMPEQHGATVGLGNRTVPVFTGEDDWGSEPEDDKEDD